MGVMAINQYFWITRFVAYTLVVSVGSVCVLPSVGAAQEYVDPLTAAAQLRINRLFHLNQRDVPLDVADKQRVQAEAEFFKINEEELEAIFDGAYGRDLIHGLKTLVVDYLEQHKKNTVLINDGADYRTAAMATSLKYEPEHVLYILNFAVFTINALRRENSKFADAHDGVLTRVLTMIFSGSVTAGVGSSFIMNGSSTAETLLGGIYFLPAIVSAWGMFDILGRHVSYRQTIARQILSSIGITDHKILKKFARQLSQGNVEPLRAHLCALALEPASAVQVRVEVEEDSDAVAEEIELTEEDFIEEEAQPSYVPQKTKTR